MMSRVDEIKEHNRGQTVGISCDTCLLFDEIDRLKAQLKEAEEVLIRIRNYHTDMNIALGKMGECKCPDCCDILHYQKEIKP